jgi:hypothetical protein
MALMQQLEMVPSNTDGLTIKIERKIKNLEAFQEMVEVSVDTMLDYEQRKFVDLVYFKNMIWQQISKQKKTDKNKFYARQNNTIKVLAWCFGYLPEDEIEGVLGIFMNQAPVLWEHTKVG